MKLPLLFLMIFNGLVLNAQLHIAPSENADSYIYAKDRMVFVEGEIHLNPNIKTETEASFYLRKGSQLLQGNKNENQNSGNGQISLFQKGTSNAFDYNYWSMPLKMNGGKINDYVYEAIGNTSSKSAKLISSLDGHSNPLAISSRWLYTFSGSTYSNWAYVGDEFDLIPGEGFTMKGVNGINLTEVEGSAINPGNAQTYDFRGTPNDGFIELPIHKDQVLLIGNPYPSALDLNKFLTENTSTTGIAYFWDSKENGSSHYLADYEGGYGTYSPGTGLYIPPMFKKFSDNTETGESGIYYERKIAPIAQGFMVIGSQEGAIQFKNTQRIYQKEDKDISMFKNSISNNAALHLEVEVDNKYIQNLALVFDHAATNGEDHAMDARKMNEDPIDVSWYVSEKAFVVNVRPKIDQELIPLKIKLDKSSELKFSIKGLDNFNPDRVFIHDAEDSLYYSIKTGYLKIVLEKGEYQDRFFLSYIENITPDPSEENDTPLKEDSVKPENILLNTFDIFQNNLAQQLEIKILHDVTILNARVYDLNGKLVLQGEFKAGEKEIYFPTSNLSNTIYIVKVNTSDHKELTKKIRVRN